MPQLKPPRNPAKAKRAEAGSAIVEFGLVLMPTLGFSFLLLTLAWAIFAWACVQEAVREGVRAAITCTPTSGLNANIKSVVETYSFGFVNSSNVGQVVSITYYDPSTFAQITSNIMTDDIVKVSVKNLTVNTFAPVMWSYSPLTVGASSADVMSCSSAATP